MEAGGVDNMTLQNRRVGRQLDTKVMVVVTKTWNGTVSIVFGGEGNGMIG